jgi:YbbR domain-containing protein
VTDLFPPSPSESPRSGSSLRSALTERLGLKATALVIAMFLWFVVSARQPTQAYVRVRVAPSLDSSLVLREQPSQLEALVVGRAADILKLYADPPVVRRVIGGDVPDTFALDVTPSDVRLPAELTDQVKILDVQPRSVVLHFESSATQRVPVTSDGRITLKQDTTFGPATDVRFEPAWVRITGPRRIVRQVRSVHPFSLTIAQHDTLPHVADLDTTGFGVRVQPAQVKVTVRGTDATTAILKP